MRKPQTTQLSDKSIADSAKAIARDPDLSVIPDNSVLAVRLGMQTPETGINQLENPSVVRGVSDSIAVVAAHHCNNTHQNFQPYSLLARTLFNEMERLRCESVGSQHKPGLARNLAALWQQTLPHTLADNAEQLRLVFSHLTKKALLQPLIVTDAIAQVLTIWQEPLLNGTRELWPQLNQHKHDQSAFAQLALTIIATINEDTTNPISDPRNAARADEEEQTSADQEPDDTQVSEDDDANLASIDMRDGQQEDEDKIIESDSASDFDKDLSKNRDAPVDADSESNATALQLKPAPYRSYSNTFDEIVQASKLYSDDDRNALRLTLDEHIERHSRIVGKLSGQLQRLLMANQNRHWKFDLEEGLLDSSRLTRIITQPYNGLSFKE